MTTQPEHIIDKNGKHNTVHKGKKEKVPADNRATKAPVPTPALELFETDLNKTGRDFAEFMGMKQISEFDLIKGRPALVVTREQVIFGEMELDEEDTSYSREVTYRIGGEAIARIIYDKTYDEDNDTEGESEGDEEVRSNVVVTYQ